MIPPAFRRLARRTQVSRLSMPVTVTMDGAEISTTLAGRPLMGIPAEERQFAQQVNGREVITSAPVMTLAGEDLPRPPKRGDRIACAGEIHLVSQALKAPLGKWDCLLGKA